MSEFSFFLLVLLAAVTGSLARGPVGQTKKPEKEPAKEKKCPPSLSRGWADDVNWVQTYKEGLYKARKSNRPLMVIHHLEDCQFSQKLKKAFAENKEVQKMAKEDFVMLNLVFETEDANLWPDGQYVPRILFIDPSLTVRADLRGRYDNRRYTYEEGDIDILIQNMKAAQVLLKQEL
ncbi:anterior gradient protein 3-like [Hypanus sabinus]|uniref:anterior gradient protein 3-like n=1 Tax=Hypanus sabinus TaxID=79690 RepID=UPI0028C45756|nr:anterior gradient protein 3-like [Hypanus sabinus]